MIETKIEYKETECLQIITCRQFENASYANTRGTSLSDDCRKGSWSSSALTLNLKCSNGKWLDFDTSEILPEYFYCIAFVSVNTNEKDQQQCNGCKELLSGGIVTEGMSEGRSWVTGHLCNKRIYCETNQNDIAFIKFQLLNGEKGFAGFVGSAYNFVDVYCFAGNWFLKEYPDIPLSNIYYCETAHLNPSKYVESCKTKTSSIQTSELTTVLTTIPTVVPATPPPIQQSIDYKIPGFELISSPSNPFSVGLGKFIGYFQNQSFCKKICEQKRGLLTCIGYTFEPNNKGKCTIYQIGPPIKSMLS
uniref:Apple domain-containing protein n=1 Tax=Panagrolaimus sp. PS1159 TaxID=55785 RepID=A0AC35EZA7_9BILA